MLSVYDPTLSWWVDLAGFVMGFWLLGSDFYSISYLDACIFTSFYGLNELNTKTQL